MSLMLNVAIFTLQPDLTIALTIVRLGDEQSDSMLGYPLRTAACALCRMRRSIGCLVTRLMRGPDFAAVQVASTTRNGVNGMITWCLFGVYIPLKFVPHRFRWLKFRPMVKCIAY
jgi:hypothetical protein